MLICLKMMILGPPPKLFSKMPPKAAPKVKRHKPSKEELEQTLQEHGGSIRATAKHYGRDRRQIYRWMEQYGLRDTEA